MDSTLKDPQRYSSTVSKSRVGRLQAMCLARKMGEEKQRSCMILPPSKAPAGGLEPNHTRHPPVECPTLPHGNRAHRSHRTACLHRNPQCRGDRSDRRLPVLSFVVFKGHDISPRTLVFILQYHTENLFYKRNVIFYSLPVPTPEDFFRPSHLLLCVSISAPSPAVIQSSQALKSTFCPAKLMSCSPFLLQMAIGDSFFFKARMM